MKPNHTQLIDMRDSQRRHLFHCKQAPQPYSALNLEEIQRTEDKLFEIEEQLNVLRARARMYAARRRGRPDRPLPVDPEVVSIDTRRAERVKWHEQNPTVAHKLAQRDATVDQMILTYQLRQYNENACKAAYYIWQAQWRVYPVLLPA